MKMVRIHAASDAQEPRATDTYTLLRVLFSRLLSASDTLRNELLLELPG